VSSLTLRAKFETGSGDGVTATLFTYGAGYLNIYAALGSTDLATGLALSPTAVLNSNGSVTITNALQSKTSQGEDADAA
jgi:hypothetical protein